MLWFALALIGSAASDASAATPAPTPTPRPKPSPKPQALLTQQGLKVLIDGEVFFITDFSGSNQVEGNDESGQSKTFTVFESESEAGEEARRIQESKSAKEVVEGLGAQTVLDWASWSTDLWDDRKPPDTPTFPDDMTPEQIWQDGWKCGRKNVKIDHTPTGEGYSYNQYLDYIESAPEDAFSPGYGSAEIEMHPEDDPDGEGALLWELNATTWQKLMDELGFEPSVAYEQG